ncbi:MAG: hypothetical protein L3J44_05075 [Campylobacteraceae bacterium]|nr:hypothetical protein [Campylobacteraceae bacterium]
MSRIVDSEGFKESFTTFKRVANIVKKLDLNDLSVDENLLELDEEKALFEAFLKVKNSTFDNYEDKLDTLFSLKPVIDSFFDNVMVNVDDIAIKTNRQNLIKSIYKEFQAIADIKEISF